MEYIRRAGIFTIQSFLFNLVSFPLILSVFSGSGNLSLFSLLFALITVYGNAAILFYNIRRYIDEIPTVDSEESKDVVKYFDDEI